MGYSIQYMAHSDLETITQLVEASEDRLSHEIEMLRAQLDLVSAHLGVPTSGYEIINQSKPIIKLQHTGGKQPDYDRPELPQSEM